MGKGLWIAGIALVLGGGYGAGVAVTGKQVNNQYDNIVSAVRENYVGVADVTSETKGGFFSSSALLKLDFYDVPPEVADWTGSSSVTFDINFKHGFLKSASELTLSEGQLREKLKTYQVNASEPVLKVNSIFQYDLLAGAVTTLGEVKTDGFKVVREDDVFDIGAGSGTFELKNKEAVFNFKVASSDVTVNDVKIALGDILLEQKATAQGNDILTEKLPKVSSGSVVLTELNVSSEIVDVSLKELALKASQSLKSDRVELLATYSGKEILVENAGGKYAFSDPELSFRFNVDASALVSMIEQFQDIQAQSQGRLDNPMLLLPAVGEVTKKGMEVDITKLSLTAGGASVLGDASLVMAPFSIEEIMLDREAIKKKAELDAKLSIPKQFLAQVPGYDPQQLGFVVSMGFLVDNQESYDMKISMKEGQLEINDQPMPF